MTNTIAVIGLGYVGLPLAAEFAKIRPVIGYDIDSARVEEIRSGYDATDELTSNELAQAIHLTATSQVDDICECEIFIVTVPTPIDAHKRPDLRPLLSATRTVGQALKKGDIVIYESTVYPGCTEDDCVPLLEAESGLRFNHDFFCGYSPERINPGDREHRVADIKKITSGSTPEIAAKVDQLYASIIRAGTHLASSIKVAEAAKVIENTQRDLNIALVNELSVIFSRLGIDTLDVLEAAGSKWNFLPFRPGLVGGHCIGVDPYYLTHKAEALGYNPQVILAGRRINDNMGRYAARNTIRLMLKNGIDVARAKVGVLGISFKENCPDVRNSKVVDLVRELEAWGCQPVVWDPLVSPAAVSREYGVQLSNAQSLAGVSAIIVAVGHEQVRELGVQQLREWLCGERPVVADLKHVFARSDLEAAGITVFRL